MKAISLKCFVLSLIVPLANMPFIVQKVDEDFTTYKIWSHLQEYIHHRWKVDAQLVSKMYHLQNLALSTRVHPPLWKMHSSLIKCIQPVFDVSVIFDDVAVRSWRQWRCWILWSFLGSIGDSVSCPGCHDACKHCLNWWSTPKAPDKTFYWCEEKEMISLLLIKFLRTTLAFWLYIAMVESM